jgi:hypothetical protein
MSSHPFLPWFREFELYGRHNQFFFVHNQTTFSQTSFFCSTVQQEGHVFVICSLALENDDAETATIYSDVLITSTVSSDYFLFQHG